MLRCCRASAGDLDSWQDAKIMNFGTMNLTLKFCDIKVLMKSHLGVSCPEIFSLFFYTIYFCKFLHPLLNSWPVRRLPAVRPNTWLSESGSSILTLICRDKPRRIFTSNRPTTLLLSDSSSSQLHHFLLTIQQASTLKFRYKSALQNISTNLPPICTALSITSSFESTPRRYRARR